ncbi:hypothetical protein DR85_1464 [Francisella tularensis]|nr:hypothetical protein DR85_1464 [Francisella tularensis]
MLSLIAFDSLHIQLLSFLDYLIKYRFETYVEIVLIKLILYYQNIFERIGLIAKIMINIR